MKEKEMTEVKLQKLGFVSSRESIEEAQEHFMFMLDTVKDKEDKFAMNLAFYVFWNTLADNYRIYKKETTTNKGENSENK